MDRDDFLTYVGFCKGNLLFANLENSDLPPAIQAEARLAPAPDAPLDWYRELYRLYEQVRRQDGIITFDDMLLSGWAALVTFPEVLTAVQQQYQCVLVDEFQDINLVQSEILDLLTQPHRNYMAIGDDDQTIYEWRSANPRFILDLPSGIRPRPTISAITSAARLRRWSWPIRSFGTITIASQNNYA